MIDVTDATFAQEVLKHSGLVLVDFWAPWCSPCKTMVPILDDISRTMKSVKVVKINVDENSSVSAEYGVRGIPTIIFFKQGEPVGTLAGLKSKVLLESTISSLE